MCKLCSFTLLSSHDPLVAFCKVTGFVFDSLLQITSLSRFSLRGLVLERPTWQVNPDSMRGRGGLGIQSFWLVLHGYERYGDIFNMQMETFSWHLLVMVSTCLAGLSKCSGFYSPSVRPSPQLKFHHLFTSFVQKPWEGRRYDRMTKGRRYDSELVLWGLLFIALLKDSCSLEERPTSMCSWLHSAFCYFRQCHIKIKHCFRE